MFTNGTNVETVMHGIVVNVMNVKIPSKVQRLSKTQPKKLYDIIVLFLLEVSRVHLSKWKWEVSYQVMLGTMI